LRVEVVHPVLTTCLPRYNKLQSRILEWTSIKNDLYNGQAGLQFSINSTDEEQRQEMFGGKTLKLEEISEIGKEMPIPTGRKYCLNFAYATGYKIDADRLRRLFCPSKFMVKITPIHNNDECRKNGIETIGGYDSFEPYQAAEESLIEKGFDVIVFVPSMDEENSLVTCGNAVLGGGKITTDNVINIMGINK
jgi:23S rRNA (adenine2503-C2)-methyltransferase